MLLCYFPSSFLCLCMCYMVLQGLLDANTELKGNLSLLQGSLNSTMVELYSTRQALNLSKVSSARLQGEVATLQLEASALRLNLSALMAEGGQLANTTASCNLGLEGAISRALGFEAGVVFLAVYLLVENLLRPIWIKYREDLFPLDR